MKTIIGVCLALLLPTLTWASNAPIEASMVVIGTITVNPDGSVKGYTLHDQDQLPPGVQQVVRQTVVGWQFVPIMSHGKAVTARTGMSLRVVANLADRQHPMLRVAGEEFGCDARSARKLLPGECPPGSAIDAVRKKAPRYPRGALRAGVGGEVFLVLQVDRGGRVVQAATRQVNLYSETNNPDGYRRELARASLKAARKWQFQVPAAGPEASHDHWTVQLPVKYWVVSSPAVHPPGYGQWRAYIPGPVQDIPWHREDVAGTADAIPGQGIPFVRDARFVLKTLPVDDASQS